MALISSPEAAPSRPLSTLNLQARDDGGLLLFSTPFTTSASQCVTGRCKPCVAKHAPPGRNCGRARLQTLLAPLCGPEAALGLSEGPSSRTCGAA